MRNGAFVLLVVEGEHQMRAKSGEVSPSSVIVSLKTSRANDWGRHRRMGQSGRKATWGMQQECKT